MNSLEVEAIINHLGSTHQELITNNIVADTPVIDVYEGSLQQYTNPAKGVSLTILSASDIVEKLSISILPEDDDEESEMFDGTLPERYTGRTQAQTREKLGAPLESKGYHRLPYPLSPVGGWDKYELDEGRLPSKYLYVTYDTEMMVSHLTFILPHPDD
ncbi:hypothetical protein SFA35_06370 [Pseudomonas sp. HR96]|uniref:DUF6392 family protein n=1 Tax=Pseudomonas sp. HR96 TaxID=1027966 RepID=UPI002A765946|nr:hypothetical protein [Pseudomonas sp. HR96]WPP00984.1 hypothetical protein SFA35_06370 [Pseudomonas sp. HR96]